MKTNNKKSHEPNDNEEGYPLYPDSEDIYHKSKKAQDLTPAEGENLGIISEKDYKIKSQREPKGDLSENDLDIPGSELDDKQEDKGAEDEENNFYSLGSDNHDDLEEDNQ